MPLLLVVDREQLWRIRHSIRVALYSHESHIESRFGLTCQLSVIKSFDDERLFKKTLLLENNDLTNVITTKTFILYFPMACTLRHGLPPPQTFSVCHGKVTNSSRNCDLAMLVELSQKNLTSQLSLYFSTNVTTECLSGEFL